MQFQSPSVVQAPERVPEVVPVDTGDEGAVDAAGLVAMEVEAIGLGLTRLDTAVPDGLGAAVAFVDSEPAVVMMVGTMDIAVELA